MRLGTNSTAVVVGANLSLLWLFFVTGHVSQPLHRPLPDDAPVPARLRGHTCYRLEFSNVHWDSTLTPRVAELVDSLWLPHRSWRRAYERDPEAHFSWWVMAGPDSLDMVMARWGAVGVVVRVSATGDTLTGRAWGFYDAESTWIAPDASARATPIPCKLATPTARRAR